MTITAQAFRFGVTGVVALALALCAPLPDLARLLLTLASCAAWLTFAILIRRTIR